MQKKQAVFFTILIFFLELQFSSEKLGSLFGLHLLATVLFKVILICIMITALNKYNLKNEKKLD